MQYFNNQWLIKIASNISVQSRCF